MGSPWINGRRWDLTWLIGSAVVVPLGVLLVWRGVSSDLLNLSVTAVVGGPHVFSTLLATYLDPRFRRAHRTTLALAAVAIPAAVVVMAVYRFQVLLSFFIFAASFHLLQQNAYLSDVYRARARRPEALGARLIDYGLLLTCFYPIAAYKLVHDEFCLGTVRILIPSIVKSELTYQVLSSLFASFLLAWIVKTWGEWRRGALNRPKTLLISVTTTIGFLIPAAASGTRLELAFQTVNTWHSIQYLGVIWIVLKLRKERGEPLSKLQSKVAGPGAPTWGFYGFCLLFTVGLFGVILALVRLNPFGVSNAQYYYMAVLSVLFIHYAFDGYFFLAFSRRPEQAPDQIPLAIPARL
jgi:hypothetical protein